MEDFKREISAKVNFLSKGGSFKDADELAFEVARLVNRTDFQGDLLRDFETWFGIFGTFHETILIEHVRLLTQIEKYLIQWLSHASLIIKNFSVLLLSDLLQVLPLNRVTSIIEYLISKQKGLNEPSEYISRVLSSKPAVFISIQSLIKSKSLPLATKIAFYMSPSTEVYEYLKTALTHESTYELHYILARSAYSQNLSESFKQCASRVWASVSSGSFKKPEVLALIEYCSCKFLMNELRNIDVLKSVIVSLTAAAGFFVNDFDLVLLRKVKVLIENLNKMNFQEAHRRKLNELSEKIFKLTAGTGLDVMVGDEEVGLVERFECKGQLDISAPVYDIAKVLGIENLQNPNSYESVILALESIMRHLKEKVKGI